MLGATPAKLVVTSVDEAGGLIDLDVTDGGLYTGDNMLGNYDLTPVEASLLLKARSSSPTTAQTKTNKSDLSASKTRTVEIMGVATGLLAAVAIVALGLLAVVVIVALMKLRKIKAMPVAVPCCDPSLHAIHPINDAQLDMSDGGEGFVAPEPPRLPQAQTQADKNAPTSHDMVQVIVQAEKLDQFAATTAKQADELPGTDLFSLSESDDEL
jgi:hypothetical protein